MKYLKDAGFFSFSCGIENGSKTALARMAKLASLDDNIKALEIFKKYDIYVQGGFILFDNKTTLQELKENYEFLKEYNWLVSKGIFSEMYAAVGTKFTENIKTDENKKFMSNNLYSVEDNSARTVYEYMKKWQAHHSAVYDMVIDPISAPKDIAVGEMKKYYELMLQMKNIDLDFMKDVICAVEKKQNCEQLYMLYVQKYSNKFEEIKNKVNQYYIKDNLNYDAGVNKFLYSTAKIKNDLGNISFEEYCNKNEFIKFLIKKITEVSIKNNSKDFFDNHFIPCAKACYYLAKKLQVDVQDAVVLGLMHDYGKFFINNVDNHQIVGAKITRQLLNEFDYDKNSIDLICNAITNHQRNANEKLDKYSKLIINADCISYIQNKKYFFSYLIKHNINKQLAQKLCSKKIKHCLSKMDEMGKCYFAKLKENNETIL